MKKIIFWTLSTSFAFVFVVKISLITIEKFTLINIDRRVTYADISTTTPKFHFTYNFETDSFDIEKIQNVDIRNVQWFIPENYWGNERGSVNSADEQSPNSSKLFYSTLVSDLARKTSRLVGYQYDNPNTPSIEGIITCRYFGRETTLPIGIVVDYVDQVDNRVKKARYLSEIRNLRILNTYTDQPMIVVDPESYPSATDEQWQLYQEKIKIYVQGIAKYVTEHQNIKSNYDPISNRCM